MAAKKTQKKSDVKKATQKNKGGQTPPKQTQIKLDTPKKESMASRILPYVMILASLVLGICLITVHVAGMDDGAGVVGYYVQALFCALFGAGAYAIPAILAYVGVKWCVFNIKWHGDKKTGDRHIEYLRSKRRLRLSGSMSFLTLLTLSAFISVIVEQDVFDLLSFWSDGVDCIGGGLIGGSLGCLFLFCFKQLISVIILAVLLILFVMLAFGLTPDYIIARLRERHAARTAMLAEEKQQLREHGYYDEVSHKRPEIRQEPIQKKSAKRTEEMTVDQLLDDEDIAPTPLSAKVAEKIAPEPEVHIGPSIPEDIIKAPMPDKIPEPEQKPIPLDFGGDPSFDTGEFQGLNDVFKDLGVTPPTPAPSPADEKPSVKEEVAPAPLDLSKIENDELLEDMAAVAPDEGDEEEEVEEEVITPYLFPPYDLLNPNTDTVDTDYQDELRENAQALVDTLKSFRVGIKEVTYSRGPTITRYELKPEVGTRVRSIANLVDDIALSLATSGVRIEAPIPNKAAVGIEVPNKTRATVYLRDLIENPKFIEAKSRLTACLGMDVGGNPIYFDAAKMPHLLIAGTTGSGKSICINSIIISILYKAKPEDVKLILIDPKKVEFNMYKSIPHLYCPIVSEPKKAAGALASAVAEMERRFELIESVGVRDIASYNAATENDPEKEYMPQMVIIIDELADLMMTARDEVETSICRLAQKARAAGIHVILGTQRPSVDVITGLIKANVPSRIACTVTSQVDSRTIIDVAGAENLIGRGDMLFAPVGSNKPMRVQGAFVSDTEVERIVTYISENNGKAKYNTDFINRIEEEAAKCGNGKKGSSAAPVEDMPEVEGGDTKFRDAVKLAIEEGKISTSLMQRRLGVGYGRAAKMIDTMEQMGYVSKPDGNKPRRVLITMEEYMRRVVDGELGESE